MHDHLIKLIHKLSRTKAGRKIGSSAGDHFSDSPFPDKEGDIVFISDPHKDRQIVKQLKKRLNKNDIRVVVLRAIRWPIKKNAHATLFVSNGNLVASRGYYHVYSFATFHTQRNLETRLHGLQSLLHECSESTVKSIGCAEGLVLNQFRVRGAKCYGCDNRSDAIAIAREWCPYSKLYCCDAQQGAIAIGDTDITLALGVLHKMEHSDSRRVLDSIANTTRDHVAIRGPYKSTELFERKFEISEIIESPDKSTGKLRIFRRKVFKQHA